MASEKLLKHQLQLLASKKPITLMMAGRGTGKSQGASRLVLKLVSEMKSIIISGPTFRQLRIVLFRAIEDALILHGIPYHLDKSMMVFTITINKKDIYIYGVSADSYEQARGYTNVTALILDEAALHTRECLDVLLACCRGQGDPQVYLLTTPRGSSNWTAKYLDDPNCEVISCGTKSNFFLSPAYVALLEQQYEGDFYRQEILGEIVDSITSALVSPADVKRMRALPPSDQTKWRKVAGLDIGLSLGGDPSCLVVRQGANLISAKQWRIDNTNDLAMAVVQELTAQGVHTVAIDSTAIGKGPADIIRNMFPNTILVNFGSSPVNKIYSNKRAEIWMTMAKRIKEGTVCMPPLGKEWDDVCDALLHTEYQMMRNTNKMCLEPKSVVKSKLGGAGIDTGDAAALSFSVPDTLVNEEGLYQPYYNPIGGQHGWMA